MPERLDLAVGATLVEFIGALWVVGFCLAALWILGRTRDLRPARLLVAEGAVAGLSFKLAATLLTALAAPSWDHLGRLAVMVALRTLLKRFFTWEQGQLRRP